jgi:hypothetical protein
LAAYYQASIDEIHGGGTLLFRG